MLYREIIVVCSQIHINTVWAEGRIAERYTLRCVQ